MDTDSFIRNIKTKDIYKDIANDIEKRHDTSNYETERSLPIGKKNDWINERWIKWKSIAEFVGLRPKTYSYLRDDASRDKKANETKISMSKWRLKFEEYQECLQNNKIILRSRQRFKSKAHNVFTEKVNKIALSFNDDKTLQ